MHDDIEANHPKNNGDNVFLDSMGKLIEKAEKILAMVKNDHCNVNELRDTFNNLTSLEKKLEDYVNANGEYLNTEGKKAWANLWNTIQTFNDDVHRIIENSNNPKEIINDMGDLITYLYRGTDDVNRNWSATEPATPR